MVGDDLGQIWLASSKQIAPLQQGGGARTSAAATISTIEAVVEIEVDAAALYFEETREAEEGEVELSTYSMTAAGARSKGVRFIDGPSRLRASGQW
jgi:hypothetical protein